MARRVSSWCPRHRGGSVNWLQVLGTTETPHIDPGVRHQFHPVVVAARNHPASGPQTRQIFGPHSLRPRPSWSPYCGSWPLLVTVERGIPCTADVRPVGRSSAGASDRLSRPHDLGPDSTAVWPASTLLREAQGQDNATPLRVRMAGYAASASAWAGAAIRWPGASVRAVPGVGTKRRRSRSRCARPNI